MKSIRFYAFTFIFTLAVAGFFYLKYQTVPIGSADFSSTDPTFNQSYAIAGYLPEDYSDKKKSYILIKGRLIQDVLAVKPENLLVIETDSIIFPGLIDMHNHIKYNVLPLWSLAKGQFLNRYEWRKKFSPYKDAVSYNMKAFAGNTTCAAVRWAEIKSLTGGVTSIQGLGNDGKCAAGFGINNIEIPASYGKKEKIRSNADILDPSLLGSVYQAKIDPYIQKIYKQHQAEKFHKKSGEEIYDEALTKVLSETQIMDWLETFYNSPRSVKLGIKLLLGDDLGYPGPDTLEAFETFKPKIIEFVKNPKGLNMNDKAAEKQFADMRLWLFGVKIVDGELKTKNSGYMGLPLDKKNKKGLDLIEDSTAMEYFGKAGVQSVDKKVRRYLAMYETAIRRSILKYLKSPDSMAMVAHLSEGMRNDPYNRSEYDFVKKLGMNRHGLVLIHAVGLSEEQMQDAAENNISIVWSPFSNLLLYGETLDVVAAKKYNLNLALGADWTPTGSKNLLDELKIAKRFLLKNKITEISDKDLVEMATINGAKALKLENVIGKVAKGFQADLMLINPNKLKTSNPYSMLLQAGQEHIDLVVVSGNPIYGSLEHINFIAQAWSDTIMPEIVPLDSNSCKFQKAFRFLPATPLDLEIEKDGVSSFRTISGLHSELAKKLDHYKKDRSQKEPTKVKHIISNFDPIFNCEDPNYTQQFNAFVEKTLDQNAKLRKDVRTGFKLEDDWTPLSIPESEDSEEEEDDY